MARFGTAIPNLGQLTVQAQPDARPLEQGLNRARQASQQAGQQIERNLALANRSMGSLRGGLQQVGFQLQDIIVGLQAGQDPLCVLIQQGTQIAGAFGPVPALIAGVTAAVMDVAALRRDLLAERQQAAERQREQSQETRQWR